MGEQPEAQTGQEPAASENGTAGGQEPQGTKQDRSTGFDSLPPETQAEIKKLRAEAAENRRRAQEAQSKVEEYEAANASELEKANKAKEKAEKEAAESKARLLRFEVAADKQVPADAVDLLTGSTREELEAQADKLLELVKKGAKAPDFDGGAREPAPEPKSVQEQHRETILSVLGAPPENRP